MADPVDEESQPDPNPQPDPQEGGIRLLPAATFAYGLMLLGGWLWLWLRDRTAQIPLQAWGEWGLWGSLAVGSAVGFCSSGAFWWLARYLRVFRKLEQQLTRLIGPLSDHEITLLALLSSVGEEFFFRLAMQDALGLFPTVAIFALMHVGPRGLVLWTIMALLLGLAFGWMMEAGCGLLSVTLAHALINYLSLRRMELR